MEICTFLTDEESARISGGFWMRQRSTPLLSNTFASIYATPTMVNIASATASGLLAFASTGNQYAISTIRVGN
jgi:hypothetical protein